MATDAAQQPASEAGEPQKGRRRSLHIGISQYDNCNNLPGSHTDVGRWAEFAEKAGFPKEHITTLGSEPGKKPVSVSFAVLLAALFTFYDKTEAGDEVFITYSGHGGTRHDPDDEHHPLETLVASDTSHDGMEENREVTDKLFRKWIDCLLHVKKVKSILVILDCCHGSGMHRDLGKDDNVSRRAPDDARTHTDCFAKPVFCVDGQEHNLDTILTDKLKSVGFTAGKGKAGTGFKVTAAEEHFVMFAACTIDELAFEKKFDVPVGNGFEEKRSGGFTHCLLGALNSGVQRFDDLLMETRQRLKLNEVQQTPAVYGGGDGGLSQDLKRIPPIPSHTFPLCAGTLEEDDEEPGSYSVDILAGHAQNVVERTTVALVRDNKELLRGEVTEVHNHPNRSTVKLTLAGGLEEMEAALESIRSNDPTVRAKIVLRPIQPSDVRVTVHTSDALRDAVIKAKAERDSSAAKGGAAAAARPPAPWSVAAAREPPRNPAARPQPDLLITTAYTVAVPAPATVAGLKVAIRAHASIPSDLADKLLFDHPTAGVEDATELTALGFTPADVARVAALPPSEQHPEGALFVKAVRAPPQFPSTKTRSYPRDIVLDAGLVEVIDGAAVADVPASCAKELVAQVTQYAEYWTRRLLSNTQSDVDVETEVILHGRFKKSGVLVAAPEGPRRLLPGPDGSYDIEEHDAFDIVWRFNKASLPAGTGLLVQLYTCDDHEHEVIKARSVTSGAEQNEVKVKRDNLTIKLSDTVHDPRAKSDFYSLVQPEAGEPYRCLRDRAAELKRTGTRVVSRLFYCEEGKLANLAGYTLKRLPAAKGRGETQYGEDLHAEWGFHETVFNVFKQGSLPTAAQGRTAKVRDSEYTYTGSTRPPNNSPAASAHATAQTGGGAGAAPARGASGMSMPTGAAADTTAPADAAAAPEGGPGGPNGEADAGPDGAEAVVRAQGILFLRGLLKADTRHRDDDLNRLRAVAQSLEGLKGAVSMGVPLDDCSVTTLLKFWKGVIELLQLPLAADQRPEETRWRFYQWILDAAASQHDVQQPSLATNQLYIARGFCDGPEDTEALRTWFHEDACDPAAVLGIDIATEGVPEELSPGQVCFSVRDTGSEGQRTLVHVVCLVDKAVIVFEKNSGRWMDPAQAIAQLCGGEPWNALPAPKSDVFAAEAPGPEDAGAAGRSGGRDTAARKVSKKGVPIGYLSAADDKSEEVPVWFATTRNVRKYTKWTLRGGFDFKLDGVKMVITNDRGKKNKLAGTTKLTYGRAHVKITPQPGEVPSGEVAHFIKLFGDGIGGWFDEVKEQLDAAEGIQGRFDSKHILLVVHGYGVPFGDAVQTAGRLGYFLNMAATTVFSWPSSVYAYDSVQIEAKAARELFRDFLLAFAKQLVTKLPEKPGEPKTTVAVVCHSMGNYALMHALDEVKKLDAGLTEEQRAGLKRIRFVFFAAPDVGRPDFKGKLLPNCEEYFDVVDSKPEPIEGKSAAPGKKQGKEGRATLYTCARDVPLQVSGSLVNGHARAGLWSDTEVMMSNTVNVPMALDKLGHGYYRFGPLLRHIALTIHTDDDEGEFARQRARFRIAELQVSGERASSYYSLNK